MVCGFVWQVLILHALAVTTHLLYCKSLLTIRLLKLENVASRLESSLHIYGRHHEPLVRFHVFMCIIRTDQFNVSQFSFPFSSNQYLTFYEQLGGFFQKSRGRLLYRQVHAPSFQWDPNCSFTYVALYILYWLFYVLCCLCLFSMSGLCPWITLFGFPLESLDYSL